MNLQENHFKEQNVKQTVAHIQEILKKYNIITEEHWMPQSSIKTCSLRLTIKGTNIGTNGKGVDKDFARASAYAEFMERLENLHMNSLIGKKINWEKYMLAPDEKVLSFDDIIESSNTFIIKFFQDQNANTYDEKFRVLKLVGRIDEYKYGLKDAMVSLPFYSLKDDVVEYLPYCVYRPYFGSNGMCAGNTREEALVQGFSEIMERIVQKKILTEKIALPDIPEEFLKTLPYVSKRIKLLQNNNAISFKLKDCSLEGKYPVVGLVLLKKNIAQYGVKFGCHPDFNLALERTLTESAQGEDIIDYASSGYVDYENQGVDEEKNISNSIMTGVAQYPYQFFTEKPQYSFCPWKEIAEKDNNVLLNEIVKGFLADDFDIYVRDSSFLNFPAYHIIIPGCSEMGKAICDDYECLYDLSVVNQLIQNPDSINKENSSMILRVLDHFDYRPQLRFFYDSSQNFDIPYEKNGCDKSYFYAMLFYLRGEFQEALQYISNTIEQYSMYGEENEESQRLLGIAYYISGIIHLGSKEKSCEAMKNLFDDSILSFVQNVLEDGASVISKQYVTIKDIGIDISVSRMLSCIRDLKEYDIVQSNLRSIVKK